MHTHFVGFVMSRLITLYTCPYYLYHLPTGTPVTRHWCTPAPTQPSYPPQRPTKTIIRVELQFHKDAIQISDLFINLFCSVDDAFASSRLSPRVGRRRSSLREIVDFMEDRMTVYDAVLKACKEMELVGEDG